MLRCKLRLFIVEKRHTPCRNYNASRDWLKNNWTNNRLIDHWTLALKTIGLTWYPGPMKLEVPKRCIVSFIVRIYHQRVQQIFMLQNVDVVVHFFSLVKFWFSLVFFRGTRRLFSVKYLFEEINIACSKKQILPRNFDSSRKAKNF